MELHSDRISLKVVFESVFDSFAAGRKVLPAPSPTQRQSRCYDNTLRWTVGGHVESVPGLSWTGGQLRVRTLRAASLATFWSSGPRKSISVQALALMNSLRLLHWSDVENPLVCPFHLRRVINFRGWICGGGTPSSRSFDVSRSSDNNAIYLVWARPDE